MLLTRLYHRHVLIPLTVCLTIFGSASLGIAQGTSNAASVITSPVDESALVTLKGETHPLALSKYDQGQVSDSLPMQHMYLQLLRSPDQQKALDTLLTGMQTPGSSNYHQWLTAAQLGNTYGPAQQDIDTIASWLGSHGLQVNAISKSGLTLDISGTAGQVRDAFHTEIHSYSVKGKDYIANASDPEIPAALSPLVAGFNSLNSFFPKSLLKKPQENFSFSYEGYEMYDEAPADLATIYNVTPLYKDKTPITGKGQTVVVLEDTDIQSADVTKFRSSFGLSSYTGTFSQIHPGPGCSDPGKNAAEDEAALDAEWAGSVAPDATVELASCADSTTNFGGFIAAQNLLDLASPPHIMSLSYGGCEAEQGPSGNLYISDLWEQAALEGVSVFVSAGDGGPAGCDDFDTATYAADGIQANGLGSTPYNTSTGGTDFLDTANNVNSTYWSTSNSATGKSVKSYVPEMTWDDSCASKVLHGYFGYSSPVAFCNTGSFLNIVAAAGAPSFVYAKPYWQENIYGNPKDGVRDLPDVSLFASNGFWYHAILFCMSDTAEGGVPCDYSNAADSYNNSAGGTSFTAPQFASIQALINQKAGGAQGNAAPSYYDLGRAQYGGTSTPNDATISECNATRGKDISSSCTFHDVTVGTNDLPCYGTINCYGSTGASYGVLSTSDSKLDLAYPTGTGWDFATGLGTLNVTNVVNKWP